MAHKMNVPVASSSGINSGKKESDTKNNGWFDFKSCIKKQKSDFCLRPAEKLFIHCCTIFILSFRCLAARHGAIYSDKLAKFMDIMADVCSIPSLNERKRDKLFTESQIQAQAFSYYLHISLITSEDIEKIASRGRQDRVFIVAEYFDSQGKLHSNTMQLFQFAANGKWLPSYNYITKKTSSLMLHLSHAVVDSDQAIKLKLIVVKPKWEICPLNGLACQDTQSMLIVILNPSQIHWNGVIKSFPVLEKPSGLPNMRLKMKLKWGLKPKLSRGGYNLFRKCWKLHGQLLVRFLHYRWRKRTNLNSLHAKCQKTTEKAAIVPLIFEETLTNLCFDDLIRPSELDFASPMSSQFCVCSEWCSIYSFYQANPIVRFVLGQNQHLFLVPDDLVIPYHFKSICSFINLQNYYCSSMFSSILHAVYFYIKTSLEARAGNNEEAFWRSRGARILEEGYWLLRDWFVRPESFGPSKYPFDEYPDSVKYFADSLTWLSMNLKNVSDMKLNAILRTTKPQIIPKK